MRAAFVWIFFVPLLVDEGFLAVGSACEWFIVVPVPFSVEQLFAERAAFERIIGVFVLSAAEWFSAVGSAIEWIIAVPVPPCRRVVPLCRRRHRGDLLRARALLRRGALRRRSRHRVGHRRARALRFRVARPRSESPSPSVFLANLTSSFEML